MTCIEARSSRYSTFLDLASSLSKHSQRYCYHILLVENALEMTYHSEFLVDI